MKGKRRRGRDTRQVERMMQIGRRSERKLNREEAGGDPRLTRTETLTRILLALTWCCRWPELHRVIPGEAQIIRPPEGMRRLRQEGLGRRDQRLGEITCGLWRG